MNEPEPVFITVSEPIYLGMTGGFLPDIIPKKNPVAGEIIATQRLCKEFSRFSVVPFQFGYLMLSQFPTLFRVVIVSADESLPLNSGGRVTEHRKTVGRGLDYRCFLISI